MAARAKTRSHTYAQNITLHLRGAHQHVSEKDRLGRMPKERTFGLSFAKQIVSLMTCNDAPRKIHIEKHSRLNSRTSGTIGRKVVTTGMTRIKMLKCSKHVKQENI